MCWTVKRILKRQVCSGIYRLRVFENRMLRRIFGPKRNEIIIGKNVNISLLQAVEAPRIERGRGSDII
jgi:hypothetical protein